MKILKITSIAILLATLLVGIIGCAEGSPFPDDMWTMNIYPGTTLTYDLGSTLYRWHHLYSEDAYINALVSDPSDLNVNCGVGNTLVLTAPVYREITVPMAQAKAPTALSPTWIPYQSCQVPYFSAIAVNVIYFVVQMPHDYQEGTDLEFHIHIAHPDANAGDSRWYCTYSWANVGDDFAVPLNGFVIHASPLDADEHEQVEVIPVINGAGMSIDSVILCSISRIGTALDDTYPSDISLFSADFIYQADTMGSRGQFTK